MHRAGHGHAHDGFERGALGTGRAPARPGGPGAGRSRGLDGTCRAAGPLDPRRLGPEDTAQTRYALLRRQGCPAGDVPGRGGARRHRPDPLGGRPRDRHPLRRRRSRLRRGLLVDLHLPAALAARLGRHARRDGLRVRPLHRAGLGDHGPGGSRDDHHRGGGRPRRALARRLHRPGPAVRRRAGGVAGRHALAARDQRDRRNDGDRGPGRNVGGGTRSGAGARSGLVSRRICWNVRLLHGRHVRLRIVALP